MSNALLLLNRIEQPSGVRGIGKSSGAAAAIKPSRRH
jgi:hypothetical protein